MHDFLARKLSLVASLSPEDQAAVASLVENVRQVKADHDIIAEGDDPTRVHLMMEGWAVRTKTVPSGARQITAILLPGDFCDLHVNVLDEMDHSIVAITAAKVAYIHPNLIEQVTSQSAAVARAFWWLTLLDEAILRSWIVNLGRRSAEERIAHLICELHVRLERLGLARGNVIDFPLTQTELADATGLTSVHTNRMLRRLRELGLVDYRGREMELLDPARLRKLAGFDDNYLHAPMTMSARRSAD